MAAAVAMIEGNEGRDPLLLLEGRQPGQQADQGRGAHGKRPHRHVAPRVEQRIKGEVEPIELEIRRHLGHVRRGVRDCGKDQGKQRQHRRGADGEDLGRAVFGPAHPLQMHPEDEKQDQRHRDMDEDQQGEETVIKGVRRDEIAGEGRARNTEDVEPFAGGDGDVLGEGVPDQPITGDAGGIDQPQHRHAGEPGEPTRTPQAVHRELAQNVDHHHRHHGIGAIAMEAAHDAAEIPLFVCQVLDGGIDAMNAGLENDVEVDAGDQDDPKKQKPQSTQVIKGIELGPESGIEDPLQPQKEDAKSGLEGVHLGPLLSICMGITLSGSYVSATRIGPGNSPLPRGSKSRCRGR